MKIEKFKVLLYLKKSGLDRNGKAPIMGRITVNRTMAQFSCKLSCTPGLWNPRESRLDGKSREAVETNAAIDRLLLGVNAAFDFLVNRCGDFDANDVKEQFQGSMETRVTLMRMTDAVCEELKSRIGIDRAKTSYATYHYTRRALAEFIQRRFKVTDLAFDQLAERFIHEFQTFITDDKGLSIETARHYLAILKKVCRRAFREGHSAICHFHNFSLPKQTLKTPRALSRESFEKIRDVEIPPHRRTHRLARDLFLFACFTGLAYADVQLLYPHHIGMISDGRRYIRINRRKTKVEAFIPLHPIAERILSLYNTTDEEKPVFPLPSRDAMWFEIHELGVAIGKNDNLSYHCSRHFLSEPLQRKTLWMLSPIPSKAQSYIGERFSYSPSLPFLCSIAERLGIEAIPAMERASVKSHKRRHSVAVGCQTVTRHAYHFCSRRFHCLLFMSLSLND